jgi:hypothetical protein
MTTICSTDQAWGPAAALAETGPAAVAWLRPTRPDKSGPGDGTLIGADRPLRGLAGAQRRVGGGGAALRSGCAALLLSFAWIVAVDDQQAVLRAVAQALGEARRCHLSYLASAASMRVQIVSSTLRRP